LEVTRQGCMALPESRRGSTWIVAGLVLVILIVPVPLSVLAQAEIDIQKPPRHPSTLTSQSLVTLNSTNVALYLVKLAEALASNAQLVMARSQIAQSSSKTLLEEAKHSINKGFVVSFAAARWTDAGRAPPLLVSLPEGGNETFYYIDSIGAEAFILDVASAIYKADYEAYLRASAAALRYYELLLKPSSAYTAPEGVMIGVPVIEALPSKGCSWEINTTITLLLTGGAEISSESLLGFLSQWRYITYPLLGEGSVKRCLKMRRTTIALVSSAYLNSYVELLTYAMELIASLQPLSPDMSEFIVVQVANYTGARTALGSAEQVIKPPLNATASSSLSSGSLGVIGDIERKLLHKGIPGGFVAPVPQEGTGANATISLGGKPGGWIVGVGNLVNALRELGSAGLPRFPRLSSGSSLATVRCPRILGTATLGGLLVAAAYLLHREGVIGGLLRATRRLRLALLLRASRIGVPKTLPEAVRHYLYALRIASRLARPKEGWETPREYLNAVKARLPFRARLILEEATSVYEEYRYSKKSLRGRGSC
jgi:hypothetical protein